MITLPIPLSLNRLYHPGKHGQLYKSTEGKRYHGDVAMIVRTSGHDYIDKGEIVITFHVYRPRKSGVPLLLSKILQLEVSSVLFIITKAGSNPVLIKLLVPPSPT